MKRRNTVLIILSVLLCSLIFCSYSKNKISKVKGLIHVYGNEPFTYIGIETQDNKEYAISADEKITADLWKTQGSLIEIEGYIVKPDTEGRAPGMLKNGKIEVLDWKYVK